MSILQLDIEKQQPGVTGAGFWIRGLARLVDWLYGNILGLCAGIAAAIGLAILQGLSIAEPGWIHRTPHFALLLPVGLIGDVFFRTICEGVYGATPGKLICGLRVLSEAQKPCDIRSAMIRSIGYFFDAICFGLVGYLSMNKTPLEQRYGDHWAETIVVHKGQVPLESKLPTSRCVSALVAGSFAGMIPVSIAIVLVAYR